MALQGGPSRALRLRIPGRSPRRAEGRVVPRGDGDSRQGRLDSGDSASLAGARARRGASPPRLAVGPGGERRPAGRDRDRFGSRRARARRLPEGLHGRDARLTHGVDDRRHRSRNHLARGAGGHPPACGEGPLAGRGARDRRPRQPKRARRVRGDEGSLAAARATTPHRARAVPDARGRAALRRARPDGLGAVLPRAVRRGPRAPLLVRPPRRRLLVPLAARRGHAIDQRLGRADRGAAAVAGDRRRRSPPLARGPAQ